MLLLNLILSIKIPDNFLSFTKISLGYFMLILFLLLIFFVNIDLIILRVLNCNLRTLS